MKTWADLMNRRAERAARFTQQRTEIDVHVRELPIAIADALASPEGCLDVAFAFRERARVVMTVTIRTRDGAPLATVEVYLLGGAELDKGPLWNAILSTGHESIALAPDYAKLVEAISAAAFTQAACTPEKMLLEPDPRLTSAEPTAAGAS